MNFFSYFVLSTLVVAGIITHAYVVHEQFYPAVVSLSTDKMCLAVMYNFAFALLLLFGKVLLKIFIGTLRDLEVEQLVDSGRGFLADTILFLVFYAPTIDNREVGTVYLIQYICCVIFMKVFHLTTQIRVSHMFEVGVPRLIVNIKLVALVCLLLTCDLMALQYFYSVASRSSTFFTWILFEALTMSTMVLVSICKYSVHMIDLRLDNGWPGKSVCLFYIDLVHDVVSMTLFLVFMLTFFVQNPSRLPIYMLADVIQVARKLAQRLSSFRRYRRISRNMDMRFPDATDEEIEKDEYCVICRDSLFEGSKPKKLPCNHIFHIDCLRSWLVMQQVCPTCRAEISADAPIPDPPPAPAAPAAPPAAAAAAEPAATPSAAPQPPAAAVPQSPTPASPTAAGSSTAPAAAGGSPAAPAANSLAAAAAGATAAAPPAGSLAAAAAAAGSGGQAAPAPPAAAPTRVVPAAAAPAAAATPAAAPRAAVPASPAPAAAVAPAVSPQAFAAAPKAAPAAVMATPLSSLGVAFAPVEEIVEALQRAEDVAKFLRQQTDFWMEQVRQIQQTHQAAGGFDASQPPFLSAGGATASSSAGVAAPVDADAASPESPEGAVPTSPMDGQMAELRRLQQEQWRKKRSTDTFPAGSADAS